MGRAAERAGRAGGDPRRGAGRPVDARPARLHRSGRRRGHAVPGGRRGAARRGRHGARRGLRRGCRCVRARPGRGPDGGGPAARHAGVVRGRRPCSGNPVPDGGGDVAGRRGRGRAGRRGAVPPRPAQRRRPAAVPPGADRGGRARRRRRDARRASPRLARPAVGPLPRPAPAAPGHGRRRRRRAGGAGRTARGTSAGSARTRRRRTPRGWPAGCACPPTGSRRSPRPWRRSRHGRATRPP